MRLVRLAQWPFSLLMVGCAAQFAPMGPVPPGIHAKEYGLLQYFAARSMNCPQAKLTYEPFGDGRHLFKGCGSESEMLLLTGADAEAYGYEQHFAMLSPATSFSKEVSCPIRETKDERVDYRTRVVQGCGKRVTYVNLCTPRCSWVNNTERQLE
jgi:hypothetical protein